MKVTLRKSAGDSRERPVAGYPSAEEMALALLRGGRELREMKARIRAIDRKKGVPRA